ncbi:DUF1574 family protein [Pseudanabaena biceps]|nr:DUF1574 family protein [Pseudanabaena biceps]
METISLDANLQIDSPATVQESATKVFSEELAGLKISRTRQKGDCLYIYSQERQVNCASQILEAIALSTQDLEGSVLFAEGIRRLKLQGNAWALGIDLPITQAAIAAAEIINDLLAKIQQESNLLPKLAQTRLKLLLQNNCLNLLCETSSPILQAEVAIPILDTLRNLQAAEYFQSVTVSNRAIGEKKPSWSFEIDLLAIGTAQSNAEIFNDDQLNASIEPSIEVLSEVDNSQDLEPNNYKNLSADLIDRLMPIGKFVWQFRWLGQKSIDESSSFKNISATVGGISLAVGVMTAIAIDRTLSYYAQSEELTKSIAAEVKPSELNVETKPKNSGNKQKTVLNFNISSLNEKLALIDSYTTSKGRSPDVLIVGSSRALRGVEPETLEKALIAKGFKGISVFNLGIDGATAKVVNLQVTQMLTRSQLPRMIIWADGLRAFNSKRNDITYDEITASTGYQQLKETLKDKPSLDNPNNANIAVTEVETTTPSFNPIAQALSSVFATTSKRQDVRASVVKSFDLNTHLFSNSETMIASNLPTQHTVITPKGFISFDVTFDPNTYFQKYPQVPGDYDLDYRDFETSGAQFDAFANVIDFCRRNGIELVVVNMPLHSTYLDVIRTNLESIFNQKMQSLALREGFTYIDISHAIQSQAELFSDPSHLNKQGAIAISKMLGQNPQIPWKSLKP